MAPAPSSRYSGALLSNHCPAAGDSRKGSCSLLIFLASQNAVRIAAAMTVNTITTTPTIIPPV